MALVCAVAIAYFEVESLEARAVAKYLGELVKYADGQELDEGYEITITVSHPQLFDFEVSAFYIIGSLGFRMVEHWNPQPIGNIAQRTRVNSQVRYVDHAKSWRPTLLQTT
jgi:hypothetical protein